MPDDKSLTTRGPLPYPLAEVELALGWALDLLDMYDNELARRDGGDQVYTVEHLRGLKRAKDALAALREWKPTPLHEDEARDAFIRAAVHYADSVLRDRKARERHYRAMLARREEWIAALKAADAKGADDA